MPVCTRCHKDWPEQYWVCPEDGTVLTAARAAAEGGILATTVGIPREEDLPPGTMIGEYRVEGKLGEGGQATVFSATQPLIGKKVAIKVISRRLCADLHAVERFIGEARTVNQIQHPNLVDIFAFGVLPDGRAYLVMEWLQGCTLQAQMRMERLPPGRGIEVLLQIVDALEAAHEKGVVHRDLKPANIFVVERRSNGENPIKLLDFGIAKLADSDASVPKTRSGVAMGTAGYMSPEQARGKHVDHRTDIYALGCVAYEVLLGQVPFMADTAIDILAMHLAAAPPAPRTLWPGIPTALAQVLLDMLSKEPDRRPSLAQVRSTLLAAQRSITPTMGVPLSGAMAKVVVRRRWRAAAWTAASGAIVLAGGLTLWRIVAREPIAPVESPTPAVMVVPSVQPTVAPTPAVGTLLVHAPPGALVRIDAREITVGPDGAVRSSVTSEEEHLVVVRAAHRPTVSELVRVAPGGTAEVHAQGRSRAHLVDKIDKGKIAPVEPAKPREGGPVDEAPNVPKPPTKPAKPTGDYTLNPF